MQPNKQFKEYCTEVCNEISWKKAKPIIFKEIENHLCDQCSDYVAKRENADVAVKKAIEQMGNAAQIGQQLNKNHKPRQQWLMLAMQAACFILNNLGYRFDALAMPLPFLSYGNLSLFINAALMGFMLSVFRTEDIFQNSLSLKIKNRLAFKDGVIIIDTNLNKA